MALTTYVEAIRQGIWEEMEADERVFILGEDVGIYGGAFKVTEGMLERFGEMRVIDTPISESAIVGAAIGAALMGMRPIAEMQFIDFISCAFDQITNFAAKNRYRWGAGVPIVIRGPAGGGVHGGPFHSQNPEMYFVHTPGLKVVAPATAHDAKGLIKAAIRDEDPVIYLEHKYLYRRIKEELPKEDYVVPIGRAAVRREGRDLTILTYAAMLYPSLEAAETLSREQGIETEVIDLRSLLPLDKDAILDSTRKTGKVLVVHEDTRTGGIAGEIAAIVNEEVFEFLDGPVLRVTAPDTPVPYSPPLEEFFLPNKDKILA
ncbi:MAG TPA: alpha-ketoacid dehydrogenase subunit beta, partial [Candidatus Polarisedimenticolia bacterium]|nr:alpha-ketoacid dehydrogenase subunit beta [Candidatus Polarisedimenticolia bacterium]